jgi:hypothetical protein
MDDDGCLVYTPVANSIYTDVFTYTIWDGVTTSVGTVTIDVTA